jgi:hypothetical protein
MGVEIGRKASNPVVVGEGRPSTPHVAATMTRTLHCSTPVYRSVQERRPTIYAFLSTTPVRRGWSAFADHDAEGPLSRLKRERCVRKQRHCAWRRRDCAMACARSSSGINAPRQFATHPAMCPCRAGHDRAGKPNQSARIIAAAPPQHLCGPPFPAEQAVYSAASWFQCTVALPHRLWPRPARGSICGNYSAAGVRCSCRRGISSTRLHGRCRLSS